MTAVLTKVDHAALRTNQALIILLAVLAFVLDLPVLALAVAGVMLVGTLLGRPGFGWVYQLVLKPAGLVKPDVIADHPAPHRFAQGMGGTVLLAAAGLLLAGITAVGWGLVWLVVALAALNLGIGFCAGCAVYYWLNRLGVPGFRQSAPAGTFPGMRPSGLRKEA